MSNNRYVAVLNPFSDEGKKVVNESPPFDNLSDKIVERAVERVNWEAGKEVRVDFIEEEVREEVLSFYLMCQGVASVSYPYSNEARTITEKTGDTIRYRMFDLFRRGYGDLCLDVIGRSFRFRKLDDDNGKSLGSTKIPEKDIYNLRDLELDKDGIDPNRNELTPETLAQYLPKYAIRWTDLIPLIEHRHIDLTEEYIVDGWAVITPKKLWNFFANYMSGEVEEYISDLYDRFSRRGPPAEILEEVGERISEEVPEQEVYTEAKGIGGGELKHEAFPPCVSTVLSGVESGNRNYGVIALLTSFLSYARVSPSGKAVNRIADFIDDISVIEDDVVPLIFQAAENCKPPLFEDQPQEKANVYYHMGFGMTTQPRLRDSGKSKWYRPPNCRKIKSEAPGLCRPDELCSNVKNPLTYYYKTLSQSSSSEGD